MARARTAVDAVAERYLDTLAELDPCAATELGIVGRDTDYNRELTDYSPAGVAARADAARAALRELDRTGPADDVDVVTVAAMRERLGVAVELHEAGLDLGELNVIASPLQTMRDVFDLMATDTDDDWAVVAARLARVPARVDGYVAALRGRDEYRLFSRAFLGSRIDLDETYDWGLQQLHKIVAEQESIAARRYPGATVAEALRRLDSEPSYVVVGTEALQHWMQDLSDRAVAALARDHFDIPDQLQRLECRIAPTQTGGIYYTGPSEDFSRPGRMWWSVPPGVETFHTWRETTTVFHEGVPGHHLQIGRAVMLADRLNRWRRLACWVSGHGEGWALYAERLMAELGWLDDDGARMGMLDAQRFRAARVVIDIGLHTRKTAPDGGTWDAARAWEFLTTHSAMAEDNLRFELDRYLGWPGQAPSYAVGQRIWRGLRDEVVGAGMGLKEFHARALDLGGLPLDVLISVMTPRGPATA
ncbi:DUF885 domain-containing protein [Mycolicibacterium palauense]|uniref:DUF885 domain-containing protein n=1 Tax=Mycolicibacterium palauense TaxID=2034511 RepID=UPI000BFED7FA|nr:DUF885 domain-containing protein [Mycolicibacterium palauense]